MGSAQHHNRRALKNRDLKHSDVTELASCIETQLLLVLPPSVKLFFPKKAYGPGVLRKGLRSMPTDSAGGGTGDQTIHGLT